MTEILTESFCERCGTRYTFESAVPSQRRLSGLKVLGRGLKNFVLSDDASLDESIAAARSDIDRDATNHQLDAFHRTFSFCMSCRQYTCANCWNETEARCLSCEPLAIEFPTAGVVPEEIDPARLLRFMGADAAHADNGPEASPEHDHIEAPAAHVHDPWPVEPAPRLAWPEGFVGSSNGSGDVAPEPTVEAPSLDAYAAAFGSTTVDAWAADGQALLVEVDDRAAAEVSADVDDWAAAEASAEDLTLAAADVPEAAESEATTAATEIAAATTQVDAARTGVDAAPSAVEAALQQGESAVAEPADFERETALAVDAEEIIAAEPVGVAATDGHPSGDADHQTLSDALAAYEAAFVEPSVEAAIDEIPAAAQGSADGAEMAAGKAQLAAPVEAPVEAPVATPPIEPAPQPAIAAFEAEPQPQEMIPTPTSESAPADPEPVVEPEPVGPASPPSPAAPTDHVVQPVWRAPADPASSVPQWPTGPRWPTGIPTEGALAAQPAPLDRLAALMARTSTEAMWAASSQEILQPAAATPPVAGIRSCENCGISLSATARFCRRCGTAQG